MTIRAVTLVQSAFVSSIARFSKTVTKTSWTFLDLITETGVDREVKCTGEICMKPSPLLIVTVLTLVPAVPASAKNQHSTAKSQSLGQSLGYAYEPMPSGGQDVTRSEAIQACSTEAAKWRYSDWQTAQLTNYRSCMAQHGQPFE